MSPSSQTPPPTGLSSNKPSKMHWFKNLFSKSKPGPKLSSNLKDATSNASAPALISGHGNTGLDVPASSRANASLDLHAADTTPAISTEAHEVQPSVGKQVASAAWSVTKASAKIAETVFTGTPFNILLPALNKMFEIIDQIIENKESIAQLLLPLVERLDIVKAFKDEQLKVASAAWSVTKATAKIAETVFTGTSFNILLPALNKVFEIIDQIIENEESIAQLLLPLTERLDIVKAFKGQQLKIAGIGPSVERFSRTLDNVTIKLKNMHDEGLIKRAWHYDQHPEDLDKIFQEIDEATKNLQHPEDLNKIFQEIDEATKNLQLELHLATFKNIHKIIEHNELIRLNNTSLLSGLKARYNDTERPTCLKGTRTQVLEQILAWCKDTSTDSPTLFWLSGMAGTGKSTLATTICELLDSDKPASRLAASFFCLRQSETAYRDNIIPKIAYQLAVLLPQFRQSILDNNLDVNPPSPKVQIRDLLIQPWNESKADQKGLPPLVVVIDALDELENSAGSVFLTDLLNAINNHPDHLSGLKILVTSRPDPSVTAIGKMLPISGKSCLEEVPLKTVTKDIEIYLKHSLSKLGLSAEQLNQLTLQAEGLFIYAATVIRMIIPNKNKPPAASTQKEQLLAFIGTWPDKLHRKLDNALIDRLYERILDQCLEPLTH
uniref:NACHT domain-containing protein n=1 Tax=Mycena chlorophos TaxID=658473 RepID=A0ABQ0LLD7_MYCCL|nr:predicted protein [Mycena chlorophos]